MYCKAVHGQALLPHEVETPYMYRPCPVPLQQWQPFAFVHGWQSTLVSKV